MDYKKLAIRLKCPKVRECPIEGEIPSCQKCQYRISEKAALAITDLLARAEAAERERDTAVSDLETIMAYESLDTCQFCKNGQCHIRGGTKPCLPKWRGIKEK